MIKTKNPNITINDQKLKVHSKATEKYIDVTFKFTKDNGLPKKQWNIWLPVEYRRTGVFLKDDLEISEYLEKIYSYLNDFSFDVWLKKEEKYWNTEKKRAKTTREFFDALISCNWECRECSLPNNPNFARRIQDLKEMGYTIATNTNMYCPNCKKKTTHLLLIPLDRNAEGNGYETWSPKLRKRIIKVLKSYDAYAAQYRGNGLLPDHKFSEVRWDKNTKTINPDDMTDEQIKDKFQLLTNQINQKKREACRTCLLTKERQCPFGINYFYEGNRHWDSSIPERGKGAERGCIGCGWYDIEKWRQELNNQLRKIK